MPLMGRGTHEGESRRVAAFGSKTKLTVIQTSSGEIPSFDVKVEGEIWRCD
jgi:hypothetical protein